nr:MULTISPECIES: hypothetical protein [unclassified Pseudonocardia]
MEASGLDDIAKNGLCPVTPNPRTDLDWLRFAVSANFEQLRWADNPEIGAWLDTARLHPNIAPPMPDDPTECANLEQQVLGMAHAQNAKLEELLDAHDAR